MITLHAFGPAFGLPDASPFVMKTEIQLTMAGLPYVKDTTGFDRAPKGKLPYIDDAGTVVADSTLIRSYIERTYAVDLDRDLDSRQRAQSWAIERMLEDHLYWAALHFRWLVEENFEKGPAHFFDDAPEAIRAGLRRDAQSRVTGYLRAQGLGRHTPEEIAELGAGSIWALAGLLGEKPFMMGGRPSAVDATAASMLAHVAAAFFDSPLRTVAEGASNLMAYVDRMMARYYHGEPVPAFAKEPWTDAGEGNRSRLRSIRAA